MDGLDGLKGLMKSSAKDRGSKQPAQCVMFWEWGICCSGGGTSRAVLDQLQTVVLSLTAFCCTLCGLSHLALCNFPYLNCS